MVKAIQVKQVFARTDGAPGVPNAPTNIEKEINDACADLSIEGHQVTDIQILPYKAKSGAEGIRAYIIYEAK